MATAVNPTGYSYQNSADGGFNYFNNGAPITREVYYANAPLSLAGALTGKGNLPQISTSDLININAISPKIAPNTAQAQAQARAQAQAQAQAADPLLKALASLDIGRQTSRDAAQGNYQNMLNQYTDQFNTDRTRYQGQTTQNEQNLTGNRQAALLQAAQGGQGLRAVLAAMGALNGTGSVLADRAVSQAANKDIGDAQNTFETNATSLTNAWADTESQDRQRRAQADAARQAAFNSADTGFFNNKIDILGKLANIYDAGSAQRGNYARQAGDLYNQVARIPQGEAVPYTPVSSLYSPQNLSSYLAGTNNLQVQAQSGNTQPNVPNLTATFSKRKDELS